MFRAFALFAMLALVASAAADEKEKDADWTGKIIQLRSDVRIGSKIGGRLVRDGAELDKAKPYVVKSDDGTYLELFEPKGFILKSEAELLQLKLPKKGDPVVKDKNLWAVGTKVLPKKRASEIKFGERDEDG